MGGRPLSDFVRNHFWPVVGALFRCDLVRKRVTVGG
jgi:hypothetical protein